MDGEGGWLPVGLAELLARSDERILVLTACRLALEATQLNDPRAIEALRALSGGRTDAAACEHAALADRLDELASAAWQRGDTRTYLDLFRRARAAAALGFAHSGAAADALYEAAHACGDVDELVARLRSELPG